MPSTPLSATLINLWQFEEAPWKWPKWQKLTGVHHGLFPLDDAHLPDGWTRQDATEIRSYFNRVLAIRSVEDRTKLHNSRAGVIPGREKWKNWLKLVQRKWKLHTIVVEGFKETNVNPNDIYSVDPSEWPDARSYIPLALASVGLTLFGSESLDAVGHLSSRLRPSVTAIAQLTWSMLRVQNKRANCKLSIVEALAVKAFEDACVDRPSKDNISCAIKALAKWRGIAEMIGKVEDLLKIEDMTKRLEELMASVGVDVNADVKKVNTKLCNAQLASKEDLEFLLRLYQDLLEAPAEDSPPLELEPLIDINFVSLDESGSLGVGPEMSMTPDQLADELGFKDGLPFLFNEHRHKTGLVAWDNAAAFTNPTSNPDIIPLRLHWHQLAGIHAIVRQSFSAERGKIAQPGILVADDVGLGKTGIAISMMAFLAHAINLSQLQQPMPKVIQRRPFLGDHELPPDLPHLVIVPGTLLAQWVTELKTFFRTRIVDILVYPTKRADHAKFWAPDGPYGSSILDLSHRIIVASHSSLLQDYSASFNSGKAGKLPWDLPHTQNGARLQDTLYGREYLLCILDESHLLRNIGTKHFSALRIVERSALSLALTATPVQTKTGDAASMGRLIGVPYFFSAEAFDDDKADTAALRKAKKEASEEMDEDDIVANSPQVRRVQIESSLRMQAHFEGRIIRRTTESVDWQGNRLLNLPPITRIKAVVKLTDREMVIINDLAAHAKENVSAANGAGKFLTRKFYLDYRMACAFAWNGGGSIPRFACYDDWKPFLSTKMDVAARIIQHHLARDDAPNVTFEDGKAVFPRPSSTPGATQTMKIVIFQLFPSLRGPLSQCLELYGIKSLAIDGAKSYKARASTVARFKKSKTCRVLIISSVGSAGLNLAFCSCVIYIDQTWSSQDERQIDGRVWRQPQDKEVKIYHILADQTSDIMLSGMASTKHDMLEAFLDKDAGRELMQLLSGQVILDEEDLDDDGEDEGKAVSRKPSTMSLNSTAEEVDTDNRKGKGKMAAKRQRKTKAIQQPLTLTTTPGHEEFLSAPTALPDPPFEDHASDDGSTDGLNRSNFTSDGESSMDIHMDQLHIQTTNPLPQGKKRPRKQTPAHAEPHDRTTGEMLDGSPPSSDSDKVPVKVIRTGYAAKVSQHSVAPPSKPLAVARPGGSSTTSKRQVQQAVMKRTLPEGGSQKLYPPRSQFQSGATRSTEPPPSKHQRALVPMHPDRLCDQLHNEIDIEMASNPSESSNLTAGSSSVPGLAAAAHPRPISNASFVTRPLVKAPINLSQKMDPPASANPPGARSLLQSFPRNKPHLIPDGSRMTPPAEPFGMLSFSQPQAKNPPASAKPLGATNPLSTAPTKRRAKFHLQLTQSARGKEASSRDDGLV